MTTHFSALTAESVRRLLDLEPHPEGGHFRENFRHEAPDGGRAVSTAIYFLLSEGEVSAWHRVDAAEVWHFYAGAPLVITLSPDGHETSSHHLGPDLLTGQRPQYTVPPGWWQTARSLGAWTLVGCTVAPGFEYAGFELAPPGWEPAPRAPGAPA